MSKKKIADPLIIGFIERALTLSVGEWAGKPFKLQEWQKEILRAIFLPLDKNGNRVVRQVYLEVPRKSGKSTLASAIALWLLVEGEPGAQVFSAACNREQAKICFNSAVEMARNCPALKNKLEIQKEKIEYSKLRSFYKSISSESDSAHGTNPHGIILDELHTQKSRELFDTLLTGTLARRQPLAVMITTAGSDRTSFCHEMHQYAEKIIDGTIINPSFVARIFSAAIEDDWTAEETWKKANPGYGVTVKPEYFFQQVQECKDNPAKEAAFRRDHLNQWVETDIRWISPLKWDECQIDKPNLDFRDCYLGLDLSNTLDLTAAVLLFPPTHEDEPAFVLPFFFCPSEGWKLRERLNKFKIKPWVAAGHIIETHGNKIDYRLVKKHIQELAQKYNILEIVVDPWHHDQIIHELDEFTCIKFPQTPPNMAPPTKKLEELILTKGLAHAGNPVLRWNLGNISCSLDDNANYKLSKKKSRDKIDGIIALIMAIGRWQVNQISPTETQGAGIEFL
jgi:phage terminase large subunit-like protein